MLPAVMRAMEVLGILTVFIGGITGILTYASVLLFSYDLFTRIHVENIWVSVGVMIVGLICCSAALMKVQPGKANIFLGFFLLFGIIVGTVLLYHASEAYKDQSKELESFMPNFPGLDQLVLDLALCQKDCPPSLPERCNELLKETQEFEQKIQQLKSSSFVRGLGQTRTLLMVIHGLHGANGVVILLIVILAVVTWFRKADPERDPEGGPVTKSQHDTAENNVSWTEEVYTTDCYVEIVAA